MSSETGKDFLKNTAIIQSISDEFLYIEKYDSNLDDYLLFKGKFLLHFLDAEGISFLNRFLEKNNMSYDDDVYSWIGTYFLQINDLEKASSYLEKVKYTGKELYKTASKKLLLYLLD